VLKKTLALTKRGIYSWQNSCSTIRRNTVMKKIFIALLLSGLFACSGTESSDSKPNDLDRTDNDDTILNTNQIPDSVQKNHSDTTQKSHSDTTRL
jgi:hypothetical protein